MEEKFSPEEVVEICESFAKLISSVDRDWDDLYTEIGNLDKETSDLVHEVELTEFDHVEGYQLSLEIKKIRQKRRVYKDYQALISPLKEFASYNKNLQIPLFKAINEMKKRSSFKDSRLYFPRIRKDLKLSCNLQANVGPNATAEILLPQDDDLDIAELS